MYSLISRTCFGCLGGCPDETFLLSTQSMVRLVNNEFLSISLF